MNESGAILGAISLVKAVMALLLVGAFIVRFGWGGVALLGLLLAGWLLSLVANAAGGWFTFTGATCFMVGLIFLLVTMPEDIARPRYRILAGVFATMLYFVVPWHLVMRSGPGSAFVGAIAVLPWVVARQARQERWWESWRDMRWAYSSLPFGIAALLYQWENAGWWNPVILTVAGGIGLAAVHPLLAYVNNKRKARWILPIGFAGACVLGVGASVFADPLVPTRPVGVVHKSWLEWRIRKALAEEKCDEALVMAAETRSNLVPQVQRDCTRILRSALHRLVMAKDMQGAVDKACSGARWYSDLKNGEQANPDSDWTSVWLNLSLLSSDSDYTREMAKF